MANCSFCMKRIGFTDKSYKFPTVGTEFCFDCMICSVCDSKARGEYRGITGMQAFCKVHNEMYGNSLQRPITEWPHELVDARLKFLYRVRDRDMKILAELAKGPGKMGAFAETLALIGQNYDAASYLKLSQINSRGIANAAQESISVDLQECVRQINELEAFKQNGYIIPEATNSNALNAQGSQDPIQIAKVRYAKGEITKEQFHEIMQDLQS